ncbi:MAG: hypothetical protein ACUVV0_08715 [Anaerolineae bacterium]
MSLIERVGSKVLLDISLFSRIVLGRSLRAYQLEPARSIAWSILNRKGLVFAVMMSRQAGKNELSAHLETYLLNLFSRVGGCIVKAAPTYRPQLEISRNRLEEALNNSWNARYFRREGPYRLSLGKASCLFLSAGPAANVVGATASILLECDEAQDVEEEKWHRDFAPMAASTNATTVLYGTAWTENTLLAKTIRELRHLEKQDGIKRVFIVPWERVAEENPAYGEYVQNQIQRLGKDHPLIKTQYFLEDISAQSGMFPEHRRAQMQGDHLPQSAPRSDQICAFLIDVAGEDEAGIGTRLSTRDSTALTIVEVDTATLRVQLIGFPTYRVLNRRIWMGERHTTLYAALLDLVRTWKPRYVVIDATGVGAGLAAFLTRSLGEHMVIPFVFTAQSKSKLGWDFLTVCDSGRFKDHLPKGMPEQKAFWEQVCAADYEIIPGPERHMRWGVSDPNIHDDLLISAALCAVLDRKDWGQYQESAIVEAGDVLTEIDESKF